MDAEAGTPAVGLALIVRDEEGQLPVLLASIEGAFDQVVLVDTGSKDRTVEVFREWAAAQGVAHKVGEFEWVDDFAAARNFADSLLDTEWKCWADADDVLRGAENLRQLAAEAPPQLSGYLAGYDYAQDQHGNSVCYLKRERLIRRTASEWVGRVHEAQIVAGTVTELPPQVCEWVHRKSAEGGPQRNLRILRKWLRDEPQNPRVLSYLGTEEAARAKHKRAIGYFRRYLKLKTGWDEERAQVHRKLAASLLATERPSEALTVGLEAFRVLPSWPDSYLTLAQASYSLGRHADAIFWAERVLELGHPDTLLIVNPLDYTVQPQVVLAAAHGALGNTDTAIEYARAVLATVPDHAELARHAAGWESVSMREAVANTFCGSAELLVRHDEQLAALELLERTVPHFAKDHPKVVALRSALRERLAWLCDPDAYARHYEEGGSKPEDFVSDPEEACSRLPRAQFLLEGLAEQAA
ncbi:MAG: tetratricopeptide repeat-containing glycosyltransferase [Thermoanaerobaculia bacterium]